MGHTVYKVKNKHNEDKYLVWSSVVDAPVTYGLSKGDLLRHFLEEYGRANFDDWVRRVDNAKPLTEDDIICNHAGKNEARINLAGIQRRYVDLGDEEDNRTTCPSTSGPDAEDEEAEPLTMVWPDDSAPEEEAPYDGRRKKPVCVHCGCRLHVDGLDENNERGCRVGGVHSV